MTKTVKFCEIQLEFSQINTSRDMVKASENKIE